MHDSFTTEQLAAMRGRHVVTSDGEEIGNVHEIYYDESSNRPEFVEVSTGLFGMKKVVVPLDGAEIRDVALHLPFDRSHVESAPDVEEVKALSLDSERALNEHYGVRPSSGTGDESIQVRIVRAWIWPEPSA